MEITLHLKHLENKLGTSTTFQIKKRFKKIMLPYTFVSAKYSERWIKVCGNEFCKI